MSSTGDNIKKINIEIITPHKLSVAILIRDYCQYRRKGGGYHLLTDSSLKTSYLIFQLKLPAILIAYFQLNADETFVS